MAWKTVEAGSKMYTVYLGDDKKDGQVKTFEGYFTGCHEHTKKARHGDDQFRFLHFVQEDKADAVEVAVLACGQLWATLVRQGKPRAEILGAWCRLTYKGREMVKGYKQPLHQVGVEYDDADKLKNFEICPL